MWSSTERIIAFLIWIRHQVLVIVLSFIIISTVISLSISIYSAFYYFYMPSQTYISPSPLQFDFQPCDVQTQNEKGYTKCSFPTAVVDFMPKTSHQKNKYDPEEKSKRYLLNGQYYTMELNLNLALPYEERYHNRMFVTCLTLLDYNNNPINFNIDGGNGEEQCATSSITPKSAYAKFVDFLIRYPIQVMKNVFDQSSLSLGLSIATELTQRKKE